MRHRRRKTIPGNGKSILPRLGRAVPHRLVVRAGRCLGLAAYVLDVRHRRIVRRNLRFTHPEWSPERIRRLSREVFQNTGITVLEICRMGCLSREEILRSVRITGEEHLLSALKNPKGAVIISGHMGNWEMGFLFTSLYAGTPLVGVARPLGSRLLNRWVRDLRTRFGNIILDKAGALRDMVRMLRRGKVLGLLIDQGTRRSEGVEVTFFGHTVTATPVAALLARRYDCPVLPFFCIREADDRLTVTAQPPLRLRKTDDPRADLVANTQIMTHAIEAAIRKYPDQWFWFHKRWKRHYPQLYPEDLARRQRRREKRLAKIRKTQGGRRKTPC